MFNKCWLLLSRAPSLGEGPRVLPQGRSSRTITLILKVGPSCVKDLLFPMLLEGQFSLHTGPISSLPGGAKLLPYLQGILFPPNVGSPSNSTPNSQKAHSKSSWPIHPPPHPGLSPGVVILAFLIDLELHNYIEIQKQHAIFDTDVFNYLQQAFIEHLEHAKSFSFKRFSS